MSRTSTASCSAVSCCRKTRANFPSRDPFPLCLSCKITRPMINFPFREKIAGIGSVDCSMGSRVDDEIDGKSQSKWQHLELLKMIDPTAPSEVSESMWSTLTLLCQRDICRRPSCCGWREKRGSDDILSNSRCLIQPSKRYLFVCESVWSTHTFCVVRTRHLSSPYMLRMAETCDGVATS